MSSRRLQVSMVIMLATTTSLAAYMVGALAVQIDQSLHISLEAVGGGVGIYSLTAAAGLVPGGILAERLGDVRAMRVAAVIAAGALVMIGTLAASWVSLVAMLALAGIGTALMQPATNLFLARRLPVERQGLAFGAKQAAVPLASMLAGLSVPVLGLTVGWRWAFIAAALFAITAVAATVGVRKAESSTMHGHIGGRSSNRMRVLPLLLLGLGFGLVNVASAELTTFAVSGAVAAGIGKGQAGVVAGVGSLSAVAARVVAGIVGGREGRNPMRLIVSMIVIGSVGYLAIALAYPLGAPLLLVGGVVLAFSAGWGWNGLFFFTVTQRNPASPAQATAVVQTGGQLAGAIGPALFGVLIVHTSFAVGWLASGAIALVGAAVLLGEGRLQGGRGESQPVVRRPAMERLV